MSCLSQDIPFTISKNNIFCNKHIFSSVCGLWFFLTYWLLKLVILIIFIVNFSRIQKTQLSSHQADDFNNGFQPKIGLVSTCLAQILDLSYWLLDKGLSNYFRASSLGRKRRIPSFVKNNIYITVTKFYILTIMTITFQCRGATRTRPWRLDRAYSFKRQHVKLWSWGQ